MMHTRNLTGEALVNEMAIVLSTLGFMTEAEEIVFRLVFEFPGSNSGDCCMTCLSLLTLRLMILLAFPHSSNDTS